MSTGIKNFKMSVFSVIRLHLLLLGLFSGFHGFTQTNVDKTIHVYRSNQRSGSTLDIELTLDGVVVGLLKSNQSFIIQPSKAGFHKLNGRIFKNGKQFSAGNVSIKSAYIDQNKSVEYVVVDLSTKSKDLVLKFENIEDLTNINTQSAEHLIRYFKQNNSNLQFLEVSELSPKEHIATLRKSTPVQKETEMFTIIQPLVTQEDVFITHESQMVVKGKFNNPEEIIAIYLNGTTVEINDQGFISKSIKIPFKEYKIEIAYLLKNGQLKTFSFHTNRPFGDEAEIAEPEMRAGKDYALLIATNQYQEFENLSNPIFDATTIATALNENYGFEVEKLINPTLVEILTKLKTYAKKMYADDDQLLILFAGHGEYDKFFKQGYVLATDSKNNDESRVSYLSHSDLRSIINNIPCKHIFLTLDVCFGGTFDPLVAARGAASYQAVNRETYIKRKMSHRTRLYITSGGKTYVPDGRPGHHSPFARRFIEALRGFGGEDGILTFNELVSFTEKVMPEPHYGEFGVNEPGSDFLFIYEPD